MPIYFSVYLMVLNALLKVYIFLAGLNCKGGAQDDDDNDDDGDNRIFYLGENKSFKWLHTELFVFFFVNMHFSGCT